MNKKVMLINTSGVAALELAIILPLLCVMIFGIVDIGRLVDARLICTDLSREGANLASRDLNPGTGSQLTDILTYLADSSSPLNMTASGKIYITTITAGTSAKSPDPTITSQVSIGSLSVASSISSGASDLGLTPAIYGHLVFNTTNQVADVMGVSVVEVFYDYTPVTPLAQFVPGLLATGTIVSSKAVFCISGGM
jgi:Flp pilus assembly protein TadG